MAPEMFTCTHILEEPGAMTVKFLIQEKQHESPHFPSHTQGSHKD